ncbi:MAG TPA: DUF2933 domain-containing protein [Candidatus Diapherotrites archaeon]|uniref:DUF2933 domain-containing protein n=1 Tax=Candidatus Iainarchaeum sp. TaxID=3101447 RepID=A0A7J4JM26_9ARCH|nr:DUF2933 domain-containing protein [Candidatus Diapherotrites archaeon]HIH16316.1 DUF2933 domain-containing protein [Candidatus Diapherotrites archaeon]
MSWKEKFSQVWQDHTLLMLACCLVPLLLLAAALYLGVNNDLLFFGFLLLCPLLHFFLMKDMHKQGGNETEGKEEACHQGVP